MKKLNFEIIKKFGTIKDGSFEIQLNYVSWNGESPKYEIRRWTNKGTKPLKEFAFSFSEMQSIKKAIKCIKNDYSNCLIKKEIINNLFTCKIYDILEVLSESEQWIRTISIVDWKFGVRFDMRAWSADYKNVGKGISITFSQAVELLNLLDNMKQSNDNEQNFNNTDIESSLFI